MSGEEGKNQVKAEEKPPEFKLTSMIGGGLIKPGKMNKKGKVKSVTRSSVVDFLVIVSNVSGQLWNGWEVMDDEEKKNNLGLVHNLLTRELFSVTNVAEGQIILAKDYPYVLFRKDEEGNLKQGYRPEEVVKKDSEEDDSDEVPVESKADR